MGERLRRSTPVQLNYVAEGDSITFGSDNNGVSYATKYATTSVRPIRFYKAAQGGDSVGQLVTRAATIDARKDTTVARNVLSVLIGANNLGVSSNVSAFLSQLDSYLQARVAAGWTVVLCTLLPADPDFLVSGTAYNSLTATANTTIRTWNDGVRAHYIADLRAEAIMGDGNTPDNATYYVQTGNHPHPTDVGHTLLLPILATIMDAI